MPVLCAAREETLYVSLADVERWHREYPMVRGGFAFHSPENPLAQEWAAYQEAQVCGACYVLRLGEIARSP